MSQLIALGFLCISTNVFGQQKYLIETVANLINVTATINETVKDNCVTLNIDSPVNEIKNHRTKEVASCYREGKTALPFTGNLQAGQHRMMIKDVYGYEDGPFKGRNKGNVTGDYLLRRLKDKNGKPDYQIVMNVHFQGTPELQTYMLQKTRTCMKDLAPFMKGPNGESLDIKIITPSESKALGDLPSPKAILININKRPFDFRGNAVEFGTNFTCSTIGHEMLHHLGLCDEYHEGIIDDRVTNVHEDWSCRAVTAEISYMRVMRLAFDTTLPQTSRCNCDKECQRIMASSETVKKIYLSMNGNDFINGEGSLIRKYCHLDVNTKYLPVNEIPEQPFQLASEGNNKYQFYSHTIASRIPGRFDVHRMIYNCECNPATDKYCTRMMNQLKKHAKNPLPRPTCPVGVENKSFEPDIGSSGVSRVEGNGDMKVLVLSTPARPGATLLKPQHFYKILAGNCVGGAPAYEACQEYAYMPKGPICDTMPAHCHDDGQFLNGPQGPLKPSVQTSSGQ